MSNTQKSGGAMKDFMEFVEQLQAVQRFLEELEMSATKGQGTEPCGTPGCPYCNDKPTDPGLWLDVINTGY
jgi:hypothetical protein